VSSGPTPLPADPALAALASAPPPIPVDPSSRYAAVGTATFTRPDGTQVPYLRRRFIPPPERFAAIGEHRVGDEERLDVIAAQLLGDPRLFWRLCDANLAMRPEELEQPDRVLRVTLPEGVGGSSA
jgi:hypothetical protein